jgi:hypothetical protein
LQDNLGVEYLIIKTIIAHTNIVSTGLFVKFSAYVEMKAMFERASGNPDAPLKPWQHMVKKKNVTCDFLK